MLFLLLWCMKVGESGEKLEKLITFVPVVYIFQGSVWRFLQANMSVSWILKEG